ncbi:sensor histidine kinase [Pedobacter nutrimenti]|uniref:histidine kinase n=1 Tax=Pedobacter nutrimenti TaxID=1241337 RepID=A0A318UHE2_9SPHI|nr:HAMP domain-containing sensor histidine kinase [Pedobacter nutrimenti]PYF75876.1 phospho-acceptor domain-containing protein [Pedobacter nutrimenti]
MRRRIILVLILMSLCVTGITVLQLYWNYQNYKSTLRKFNTDINNALDIALNKEIDLRQEKIISKFKTWMADTTLVQITCENNNRDSNTVFHVNDKFPYSPKEKGFALGFAAFKEKLKQITPSAKSYFIEHFANSVLKRDLKKGFVYFYTQKLGDSLSKIYNAARLDTSVLIPLYKQELASKEIYAPFKLFLGLPSKTQMFVTLTMSSALKRPYEKQYVYAAFQNPNLYFFKAMKWLITTSCLLIFITLFCFGYTLRTLFSQQKLAQLKDEFINNMTHELNTPLSSIKITAESLGKFDHDAQTTKEYLNIILYQTEKLSSMANHILQLNRPTGLYKNTEDIELNALIKRAISDLLPKSKDKNARIYFQASKNPIIISGESQALVNVLINLIDNALKYNKADPKLDIRIHNDTKYSEISIADNGIGIPPEYRDKIFEKFFRVPTGNIHDVKGYGLGLFYVKEVILKHKGTIKVSSNQPRGTVFKIKIPLA